MLVLSTSMSFEQHLRRCLRDSEDIVVARSLRGLPVPCDAAEHDICVIHLASMRTVEFEAEVLPHVLALTPITVAAADQPSLEELLRITALGVKGYVNSYMADVHYQQMLSALRAGQSWVVPPLLEQALSLARSVSIQSTDQVGLARLTHREREVAMSAVSGLSNQQIAQHLGITEPTVKVHLGRVFKKLDVRNRHALTVKLQGLREAS